MVNHVAIRIFSVLFFALCGSALANGTAPDWTQGAVWYQLVPERFRNANPHNDPIKKRAVGDEARDWQTHPWAADFYKLQIWEQNRGLSFDDLVAERRYGGDLFGIVEKLDYLKTLGVEVLLLTPVFESPSALKYDAATFHHIDDNFGNKRKEDWEKIRSEKENPETWTLTSGDELFLELLDEAHKSGIRVVIEAQFRYCSREFWAFKDLEENQQDSPYGDWFEVLSWDDPATPDTVEFTYRTWQDNPEWPLFKQGANGFAEPVKKYIFDITRRWMKPNRDGKAVDGIDGWYIDNSAVELKPTFWEEWLTFVKSLNSRAVTVAEYPLESNGTNGGVDFDLFMSDDLAGAIKEFFLTRKNEMAVSVFDKNLRMFGVNLSEVQNHKFISRLGDQKSVRPASLLKYSAATNGASPGSNGHGPDRRPPSKEELRSLHLLPLFWLSYVGSPMIFYGDESGMSGGGGAESLKPKFWGEFANWKVSPPRRRAWSREERRDSVAPNLLTTYILMNQIRAQNPAIRRGSFESILVDDAKGVYGFARKLDNDQVLVFINTTDQEQTISCATGWAKGTKVKDWLNDNKFTLETGEVELKLLKEWGAVLTRD